MVDIFLVSVLINECRLDSYDFQVQKLNVMKLSRK